MSDEAAALLAEVAAGVRGCTQCRLHEKRTNAVPGTGPHTARVLFIGEGPGEQEDRRGEPFVGAAGHLLDELLASIGLDRGSVFITNVVKCRPPGNRDPEPDEIAACREWLDAQIALISPAIICPLGRHAMTSLLPIKASISQVHGQRMEHGGLTYFPLFHPAAALHDGSKRQTLFDDFAKLAAFLRERGLLA